MPNRFSSGYSTFWIAPILHPIPLLCQAVLKIHMRRSLKMLTMHIYVTCICHQQKGSKLTEVKQNLHQSLCKSQTRFSPPNPSLHFLRVTKHLKAKVISVITANCLLPLAKVQKVFAMFLVFHLRCAQARLLRLSSTSHFVFFPKNGHHMENGC